MEYRYPFAPYPIGWYQVAWSHALRPGDVVPLHAFGEELVLFRTAAGEAVALDAHCPHMGAHLGHGGRVEGESIRCPFHAWRFGLDGACVEVPYQRRGKVPQAGLRRWPVHEVSGLVLVHYHPDGASPTWWMPAIPEFEASDWRGYETRSYHVRMHTQELAENVPDIAHFLYVHETGVVPEAKWTVDDHVYRQTTTLHHPGALETSFHQTCYGLGLIWLRNPDGPAASLFLSAPTPIDDQHVDIRVSYLFPGPRDAAAPSAPAQAFLDLMDGQFDADIRIWEHKVYRERPRLVDGDGPIGVLRGWARQFYVE